MESNYHDGDMELISKAALRLDSCALHANFAQLCEHFHLLQVKTSVNDFKKNPGQDISETLNCSMACFEFLCSSCLAGGGERGG